MAFAGSAFAAQNPAANGLTPLEWLVMGAASVILAGVFLYTVKHFLWPRGKSATPINRRMLRDDERQGANHD